ncbi:homeobox protein cut-like 2 isoform X2 [Pseudorasbora parva]|uniref:homeobox protein cut-like 2 isoform X2 n=1 Tax=Pseudorasbora parva TaxID=51549 RepID=UPI00351EAF54
MGMEMMVFSSRDGEVQRLEEEVQRLQRLLQEVQERTANHIALLQQQLANKSQDIERLQARLQTQQDYEKIKTELRTLRALPLTPDQPHVESESSPPSDVRSVSVDAVIQTELKNPELHYFLGKEEPLSESYTDISGILVGGSPSSSSSSSSVSLHMFLKEESGSEEEEHEDEEEFDTAKIAQRVKEALQRQNIGQRVFGHYILGLSQGTVSDILARPKPWRNLTSRGREPFLRMKHFLSDEQSIQSLRSIQDRLRGLVPWLRPPEMSSDQVIRNILDQSRLELMDVESRSPPRGDASEDVIRNILHLAKHEMQLQPNVATETTPEEQHYGTLSPSAQSPADFVQSIIQKVKCEMDEDAHPSSSPASLSSMSRSFQKLPVDLEPRALVCVCPESRVCVESCEDEGLELDTLSITHRVKEALIVNNIVLEWLLLLLSGQRVFGEEVLGLTQSSVSELLSHPKPWTKLSLKGKENFIRMHRWLQDPHNIHRLTTIDQRARLKRDSLRTFDASGSGFCPDPPGAFEAVKRPRVVLCAQEKEVLRVAHRLEPYPSQHTIQRLASQLGLQNSTVSNWFYNYRSRIRRDGFTEPVETRSLQSPASSSPVSSGLVSIKQESGDPEMEDTHQHMHVSVAVQSVMKAEDFS